MALQEPSLVPISSFKYRIAGKFGGDLNLAYLVVGVETAKLKSTNIILAVPTMHKTSYML